MRVKLSIIIPFLILNGLTVPVCKSQSVTDFMVLLKPTGELALTFNSSASNSELKPSLKVKNERNIYLPVQSVITQGDVGWIQAGKNQSIVFEFNPAKSDLNLENYRIELEVKNVGEQRIEMYTITPEFTTKLYVDGRSNGTIAHRLSTSLIRKKAEIEPERNTDNIAGSTRQRSLNRNSGEGQAESQERSTAGEKVFMQPDQLPSIPGGIRKAITKQLSYPKRAMDLKMEGRVVVRFIVTKWGNVKNPEIIKGLGFGLDEAVLDVVKKLTFEAGKNGGEKVNVLMTVPVDFKLKN